MARRWSTGRVAGVSYRVRSWAATRWRPAGGLVVAVGLAGAVALTLVAGTLRTSSAPDRAVTAWGSDQDLDVEQASGPPRIAELAALDGVERAEMATFVFGALVSSDHRDLISLVFAGEHQAIGMRITEGRAPRPDRPGEFVATESFVAPAGLHLGDEVQLVTYAQATSDALGFDAPRTDGPTVAATLVGIIAGPGILEGDSTGLSVFPRSVLAEGDIGVAASEASLALAPGVSLDDIRAELDRLPASDAFAVSRTELVPTDVRDAVATQARGLAILTLIVAVTVIAVLGQLLSRQFRLDPAERRALSSLGYSRRQIALEQGVRAALTGGLGAVGAGLLAWAASGSFPIGFSGGVEPHPGRRLDLVAHGAGTLALVVALVLWVAGAERLDAREHPPRTAPGLVDRLAPWLPSASASTGLRFAFTPTGRIRTSRASLVGLTAVFCVLFGAVTFGSDLNGLVGDPSTYSLDADVYLGQGGSDIGPVVEGALAGNPDVAALTLFGTSALVIGNRSLDVIGMRAVTGHLVPELLEGRSPIADDEIVLGPVAARELGVGVGDRITGRAAAGRRALQVVGIGLIPGINGADVLGAVGLMSEGGMHGLDPATAMSAAAVDVNDGAPPGAVGRIRHATGMETGQLDPPADITNLERVRSIPAVVALSVGLLGVLSLGHLMLVGAQRRRRDLAVLQAVGADRGWTSRVIHWQATLTAAAVVVVAAAVGSLAGASLYRRFATDLGARPTSGVPFSQALALLVVLLVLTNLAAAIAARRMRRDRPATVLAAG